MHISWNACMLWSTTKLSIIISGAMEQFSHLHFSLCTQYSKHCSFRIVQHNTIQLQLGLGILHKSAICSNTEVCKRVKKQYIYIYMFDGVGLPLPRRVHWAIEHWYWTRISRIIIPDGSRTPPRVKGALLFCPPLASLTRTVDCRFDMTQTIYIYMFWGVNVPRVSRAYAYVLVARLTVGFPVL